MMNKKVMTAAVAAALAAPAVVYAQASNVQIYGTASYSMEMRSATGQDVSFSPSLTGGTGGSSFRANPSAVTGAVGATSLAGAYAQPASGATGPLPITAQNSRTASQSAGSNFGIRGREDLGGGMYAGFQVEISAAPLGATPVGATTGSSIIATYRNVGLWVGNSTFGEIGMGQWDSPFTMVTNNTGAMHAAYGNASTNMSAGFLGTNGISPSTISGQSIGQYCNAAASYAGATAAQCYAMGTSFNRRVANQVWWQSPNWSGFNFRVMTVAATQDYVGSNSFVANAGGGAGSGGGLGTVLGATINELKPTMWGLSAAYINGPFDVRVGYENHKDMVAAALRQFNGVGAIAGITIASTGATAAGVANGALQVGGIGTTAAAYTTNLTTSGITGSNDSAWNLNARYNFGAFSVGAYFETLRWNASYLASAAGNVTRLGKQGYRVDGAWQGGPHTLGMQYGRNKDMTGNLDGGNTFDGTASGASNWVFGYAYSMSKRTNLIAYHTRTNNDTNARYTGIVFNGITTPAGADPRYTGLGIRHSF